MSGELITSTAGTVISVTESALGLFSQFPLNIVVVTGIVAMGIGLVRAFIPRGRKR